MKRVDLLVALLCVAILLAVGILFQGPTPHPKPKPHHTKTCRWDDLCNGVASPARIQAYKKEAP